MKSLTEISPYIFLLFCLFVLWQIGFGKILLVLTNLYLLYLAGIVLVGLILGAVILEEKIIRTRKVR